MPKIIVHLKNGETLDLCDLVSVEIAHRDVKTHSYDAEQFADIVLKENMSMRFVCASRKISLMAANILYIEFLE